jgi:murein DD-endopeptidase MepM/ murein hydrolase activator NlpD
VVHTAPSMALAAGRDPLGRLTVTAERRTERPTGSLSVSRSAARHRKPAQRTNQARVTGHRKPSAVATAMQPARLAAAAVAGSTLIAGGSAPAITHSVLAASSAGAAGLVRVLAFSATRVDLSAKAVTLGSGGLASGGRNHGRHASPVSADDRDAPASAPRHAAPRAASPVYLNPLRSVSELFPERIDMGVDFGGAGPVYALGDGVVIQSAGDFPGWPGGGWVSYRLTDGPDAGMVVYLAEDVTPTVQAGQQVTPDTIIANMYNGGDGIETGWAQQNGLGAESQTPAAGGISGGGPFPTAVGNNFDELLQALGAPAAANFGQTPFGTLPAGYPTSWPGIGAG